MITVINKIAKPINSKTGSKGQFFSVHLDKTGERAQKMENYIKKIDIGEHSATVTIYQAGKQVKYAVETLPGLSQRILDKIKAKFP